MFKKIIPGLLNKRERVILYIAIGAIVFAAALNLVILPFYARNDLMNKEIRAAQVKLNKYRLLIEEKDKIQEQINAIPALAATGQQGDDNLMNILTEIERLAQDADVRIIDIRPQKENLIDLRVEGRMDEYLKFIYNLECSPSFLKIKKLQLASQPQSLILQGSFTVNAP